MYLSADDVDDTLRPAGQVIVALASYSAGTPQHDDVGSVTGARSAEQAPAAFVAPLARRLLGHPRGGALAVLGYAGRCWSYATDSELNQRQTAMFIALLKALVAGAPVGLAPETLNERYAELSSELSLLLEEVRFGGTPDAWRLANEWVASNDLRGFTVVGDPAVRLRTG
jgi:hypothetical protein